MSSSPAEGRPTRVVLDGTPLLGLRTGIGRYVEHLVGELATRQEIAVTATAFTLRGRGQLPQAVPAGVATRSRPVPARLLRRAWRVADVPPIEWLAGRADVVHGTNYVLPPTRRAATVLTIHDLAFLTHAETLHEDNADLELLVRRAVRRVGAVTTLAESTRQRISAEFGLDADRIFVAAPGVDASWFTAEPPTRKLRDELALPERYLVFVGTREPRKGLSTLLGAYRLLRERLGSAAPELLLVGAGGWGTTGTESPAPGVRLAGYVAQSDLPSVVAGSSGLVLPSLDEGFGMPAVEALAAGVPVVVSDIEVLAEVTGGQALRFPVGDEAALAGQLERTVAGEVPTRLGRQDWARQFTWAHCADQTIAAYQRSLAHRAATR